MIKKRCMEALFLFALGFIYNFSLMAYAEDRKHKVVSCLPGHTYTKEVDPNFDFQSRTPLEFLEMLKTKKDYSFIGIHKGWILESDIPELIALLDSKERCAPVSLVISSFFDVNGSTVGAEAYFLIIGFREGKYPPGLNSPGSKYKYRKETRDKILSWYKELIKTK